MKPKEMATLVVDTLEEHKALDVRVIEITQISTLADYFIIASGTNRNQVQALADATEKALAEKGYVPKQIEGYPHAQWILMDYGDIVLHLFDEENRLFYDIERIWRDGRPVDLTGAASEEAEDADD